MQEKIKLVKAYLYKMLNLDEFASIVVSKHELIENWYYVFLTSKDEKDTLKIFITSSGVVSFEGKANFKALEIMTAINHICDDEYYDIVLRHIKVSIEDTRMSMESK